MKLNLSVIITTFNSGETIGRCLNSLANSLLHSTYSCDLEVIVVDDGSKDESLKILKKFNTVFPNYKIIEKKENTGNADTRNIGLYAATNEYITFVDSDDEVDVSYLTEICKSFRENKTDVLIFGYKRVMGDSIVNERIQENVIESKDTILKYYFNVANEDPIGSYTWNKIFKKNLILKNQIKFVSGKKFEDVPFCFNCILCARSIKCINKCLYNYIYRDNSTVNNVSKELVYDRLWSLKEIEVAIKKYDFENLLTGYYAYCLSAYFYLYDQVSDELPNSLLNKILRDKIIKISSKIKLTKKEKIKLLLLKWHILSLLKKLY